MNRIKFLAHFRMLLYSILILTSCDLLDNRPKAIRDLEAKMKELDDDTLLGPDKNGDGVRDDIEYLINNSEIFRDSDIKKSLMRLAGSFRNLQRDHKDKRRSISNMYIVISDIRCVTLILREYKKNKGREQIYDNLLSLIRNTGERDKAYYIADQHFGGQLGAIAKYADQACRFKLSKRYYKKGENFDVEKKKFK